MLRDIYFGNVERRNEIQSFLRSFLGKKFFLRFYVVSYYFRNICAPLRKARGTGQLARFVSDSRLPYKS